MISDEHLVERLRAAMTAAAADVVPPAGLLDGISPARRPSLRLPRAGSVLIALTSVCAVLVAVLAIGLLGHARGPVAPRTVPPTAQPSHAGAMAALRSQLAILRRPQRRGDEIPARGLAAEERPRCSNCLNVTKVLAAQTRLLATLHIPHSNFEAGPGPERVYLVLGTVPAGWQDGRTSGWRQRGRASHGLHLSLVGLAGRRSPGSEPVDELLNYAELSMPGEPLTPRDVMITSFGTVGVVPDGVTRVKWELANPGQVKPVAVYPRVRGNVATAPMTPAPPSTRLLDEQLLVGATWYGAGGRVLASFHVDLSKVNRTYTK
jgi:hypothetical protein